MTQDDVERILAVWQIRLRLDNWNIKIRWNLPVEKPDDGEAEIRVHPDYEQASIRIKATFADEWDERHANVTLIHELLHIFERGTNAAAQSLIPSVSGAMSSTAYELFWNRYEHESEGWIDRLALILFEIAGPA